MVGSRKLVFGLWAFTLTWAYTMWAPGITTADREAALWLQSSIVAVVIGANAYEHRQKTKRVTSGAGQAPPPAGPGTTPAAEHEAPEPPDGATMQAGVG